MTDRLARMKDLEAKATPGEWTDGGAHIFCSQGYSDQGPVIADFYQCTDSQFNLEFVLELRNAAKDLIELVEDAKELANHAVNNGLEHRATDWLSKLSEFQNEGVKR